jgi:GntR family transcriptional repressor for pyruvate dehydrogenase complex
MKLPAERQLSEMFRIGRPALREAIRALAVLEVVVSRRGDGTYIKSLANIEGGWPANPRLEEVDFDLIELLEVRKILEPKAAALAAGRATPRPLHDIEDHLTKRAAHITDVAVREQQDFLFHDAIIRAAGNRVLCILAESLTPLLIRSRRITGQTHHDMDRIIRQHKAIFESIRIRNAELAEETMRQHLLGVEVDLISERTGQAGRAGA